MKAFLALWASLLCLPVLAQTTETPKPAGQPIILKPGTTFTVPSGQKIDGKAVKFFPSGELSTSQPSSTLKIGDPPPLLTANQLLQAPAGARLDAACLRGKVVVLEFWATNCIPCVAAIPHLNELVEKFKDQPVQFASITDENEAKIKPFLEKRPIKGWIALDTDKAMRKAYGIEAIPQTVILGKDGTIAGVTFPTQLTEEVLTTILAGKTIPAMQFRMIRQGMDPDEKNSTPALLQVLVRPAAKRAPVKFGDETAPGLLFAKAGQLTALNLSVEQVLPMAFGQSAARLVLNSRLPDGLYDFIISHPGGTKEERVKLLQLALKSVFNLTGRQVTQQKDVLLLKVKQRGAPGLTVSTSTKPYLMPGPGGIEAESMALSTLASSLEQRLKTPVIDETGLTEKYDVSLKWPEKSMAEPNRGGLKKALQEQLGLELVPARRPIEVVIVEKTDTQAKSDGHAQSATPIRAGQAKGAGKSAAQ